MTKKYEYYAPKYKVHVHFLGYVMIALAILLGIRIIANPEISLNMFGFVAAVYGALNTFVFKSTPKDIIIDDESITFSSFGETKYKIAELTQFQIREFANAQFYIRVEDNTGRKARYWVTYYYFSDKDDLILELYHIESVVHPTNLKVTGREKQFEFRPGTTPKGWDENA